MDLFEKIEKVFEYNNISYDGIWDGYRGGSDICIDFENKDDLDDADTILYQYDFEFESDYNDLYIVIYDNEHNNSINIEEE